MLKFLKQRRADLSAEGIKILDKATAENRVMTAEEMSRLDAIETESADLEKQIKAAEAAQERIRMLGDGSTRDDNQRADDQQAGGRQDGKAKFSSFGEQLRAVARAGQPGAQVDQRLQGFGDLHAGPTGMSEGIAADGGFLVQTDMAADLLATVFQGGEVARRIRRIPIGPNSNGIRANGIDETSRANGQRWGGVQAFWTGEANLKRDSKPRFKRISMELDKLTGLCYATDELLQDTTALASWISQAFKDEMVFKVEDAILNGTGSGMPLGVYNSGATIMVAKEAGQAAGTIVANNILKMWSRMSPANRKNAIWLVNSEAEVQLFQMMLLVKNVAGTDNVGAIAFPQVAYTPPGTNGNEYGSLMGRPVVPVEYAAPLGTAGDIALVDLSQYLGIDKGAVQEASSIHVRFIYDETCFRFVYRFNGQPIMDKPILPYRGTLTQSPFVTLQTRG
jgi:HK97 family phage major capsid protein